MFSTRCTYLQIYQKRRLPPVVLDAPRLELDIPWSGHLHVEIEYDDVALQVAGNFHDVVKGRRRCPMHCFVKFSRSDFLLDIYPGSFSEFFDRDVLFVKTFHCTDILLQYLGLLPFFVGFRDKHRAVEAKFIVWILDGDHTTSCSFLSCNVLKRVSFDVFRVLSFAREN